ncbi:hypothetical protein ACRAWD_11490 [Caulobacter segnis]
MHKLIAIALTGAVLSAAAAPAFAQSTRWTDAEYLKADRRLGLAQSAELGTVDASGLTARIKDQASGARTLCAPAGRRRATTKRAATATPAMRR